MRARVRACVRARVRVHVCAYVCTCLFKHMGARVCTSMRVRCIVYIICVRYAHDCECVCICAYGYVCLSVYIRMFVLFEGIHTLSVWQISHIIYRAYTSLDR